MKKISYINIKYFLLIMAKLSDIETLEAVERARAIGCNCLNLDTLECQATNDGSYVPLVIEDLKSFDFKDYKENNLPVIIKNMPTFCEGYLNGVMYSQALLTEDAAKLFEKIPMVEFDHIHNNKTEVGWVKEPKLIINEFEGKKKHCINATWELWNKDAIIRLIGQKQEVGVSPKFLYEKTDNPKVAGKLYKVIHESFTLTPANPDLKQNTKMTEQCTTCGEDKSKVVAVVPTELAKSIPLGTKEELAKALSGLDTKDLEMVTEAVASENKKRGYAYPPEKGKEKEKDKETYSVPPKDDEVVKMTKDNSEKLAGLGGAIQELTKKLESQELSNKIESTKTDILASTAQMIEKSVGELEKKLTMKETKEAVQEAAPVAPVAPVVAPIVAPAGPTIEEQKAVIKEEVENINQYVETILAIEEANNMFSKDFTETRKDHLKTLNLAQLSAIYNNYKNIKDCNETKGKSIAGEQSVTQTASHSMIENIDDVIDKPFPSILGAIKNK